MNKKKTGLKFIYFFVLAASIIITLVCPKEYSRTLCTSALGVYIICAGIYLKSTSRFGLLSFDLFFLLGILLTCFLYPIFFLGNEYLIAFTKVNPDILNKATLLSLVGAISYMLGSMLIFNSGSRMRGKNNFLKASNLDAVEPVAVAINIFLIIGFINFGGLNYTEAYNFSKRTDLSTALGFLDFYKISVLVLSTIIFLRLKNDGKKNIWQILLSINKIYFLSFLFIIGLLLIGGTRNLPIQLLLVILGLYNLVIKKISNQTVIILALVGLILFTAIRIGRENIGVSGNVVDIGTQSFQDDVFLTLTSDLLVSSAPLYVLVDEADVRGFAYGKPMLLPFLSSVPFAQFAVIGLFNFNLQELEPTSMLATYLIFGSFDSGAGTNVIGDLYYSWGIVGVILLMMALGVFVSFLGNKIFRNEKIEYLLIYMGLFSISFFFARAEFMYGFRYIFWSFLLFKLFMFIRKQLSHPAEVKTT